MEQSETKPLVITLNEARLEITKGINYALQSCKLPCYLIEPILRELLAQVKEGARNELEMAKVQMSNMDISDNNMDTKE